MSSVENTLNKIQRHLVTMYAESITNKVIDDTKYCQSPRTDNEQTVIYENMGNKIGELKQKLIVALAEPKIAKLIESIYEDSEKLKGLGQHQNQRQL